MSDERLLRARSIAPASEPSLRRDEVVEQDNILAVAGAAKLWALVLGLAIAVAFVGPLSAYIAKLLARYHWITWIGERTFANLPPRV